MKFLLALIVSLYFIACSNSESFTPPVDETAVLPIVDTTEVTPASEDTVQNDSTQEIEGMLRLSGDKVMLGTNDKSFKANERPAMKVSLDYDFYMDIHEVTCGEYASIAKKAELKTFGKCENDSLPLTDITYYDAILFANAKSKLEERDTVYTYRSAIFDDEKHCTNLEGFAFHADVEGYRLPTEAEWVYATTLAWDTKNSWNNSNSEYKLHPVCSKDSNSAGFCDMAGNAMEWVNDWLGLFRDTTVSNYVGAPDGGDMGERIVKGGGYNSSVAELNPYSRGDVYTVTSSTRAEYVGFRLALGAIPNALWMNSDGNSTASIVTPIANSEIVKNFTKSYNTKLAFRNDVNGKINYIDYSDGTLSVTELSNDINAYHPEISPDGEWVAFSTGYEGISGTSAIYVQSLDTENPSEPIKLNVKSAAIPRWRILENGDTAIVYVTDAGNNKDETAFKAASTWQVTFANGEFGTPQKLFDGAYHGGINEDNSLAVSGARLLRARVSDKESIWYNSEQACNVSFAQDGSKRVAFLDFGGKTGKAFVGSNYATHQQILIADSTGKLIQAIKAPEGYTFDHSEWTTDGENTNIVATLTNVNGAHTKIVLINPIDSSIIDLAEGDELWHPNLWVKKIQKIIPTVEDSSEVDTTFHLDLDSAGMYYNTSGVYTRANILRYKMEMLWQYKDTANTVILGSSRTYRGVNPLLFSEPIFAVNLAVGGTIIHSNNEFFHNYVLPHYKNLKLLIISIDPDRGGNDGMNSENMFYEAYKSYPGYVYDKNHNYWKDEYPEGLFEATYNSPGPSKTANKHRPTRGFLADVAHGWGEPAVTTDSNWLDENFEIYQSNFNEFAQLLETCNENGITVIGVITPQNPRYNETGAFGRAGLRRSDMPKLIQEIADLNITYPNFILMDENNMGNHDYTDDMANDTDHLSEAGAAKLTHRLDSLIKTLDINFTE